MSRTAQLPTSAEVGPSDLTLDARCIECGDDLDGGLCLSCPPSRRNLPAARTSVHGDDVFHLLRRMRDDRSLESVDDEVAALVDEAVRLARLRDMHPDRRGISEADLAAQRRQVLQAIVGAKKDRQQMIERGRYFLSADVFRSFLYELERAIRGAVTDPVALGVVLDAIGRIQVRVGRAGPA